MIKRMFQTLTSSKTRSFIYLYLFSVINTQVTIKLKAWNTLVSLLCCVVEQQLHQGWAGWHFQPMREKEMLQLTNHRSRIRQSNILSVGRGHSGPTNRHNLQTDDIWISRSWIRRDNLVFGLWTLQQMYCGEGWILTKQLIHVNFLLLCWLVS